MKKFLNFALVLALAATMCVPALATEVTTDGEGGNVPVELTAEAATFSVTVPTVLPIAMDKDGVVTVADDVYIVNNSFGSVKVSDMTITGANDWQTVDFDSTDMSKVPVNSKDVAMAINGGKTTGADAINFAGSTFPASTMDGVMTETPDSNKLFIDYDAKLPAQSAALNNVVVATVVFTVCWNTI